MIYSELNVDMKLQHLQNTHVSEGLSSVADGVKYFYFDSPLHNGQEL
jgi:hypothetical protein